MDHPRKQLLDAARIVAALKSQKRAPVLERLQRGDLSVPGFLLDEALDRIEILLSRGIRTFTWGESRFPSLLREIPDPPLALYLQGEVSCLDRRAVAVVGSRRASANGILMARDCAGALASRGVVVVSGLASGIDAAAHEGALAAGGMTVAVLGGGLDRIYPAHHRGLAERIVESGGALISEYPPEISAHKRFFPERNRIISGLSEAVLVIEASVRSGSLITARMALEQGRDVLAVPGSVFAENSRGCHRLIREGAALIDSIETLLEELNVAAPASPESGEPAIKGPGALLLALSETTPQSAEDLAQCSGDSLQEVLLTLLELEDRGFVALMNGGYIRLPSA